MMSGLAAMQRSPADMLRPGKPVSGLAKTYPSRQSMAFVQRATEGLTARLLVTGEEMAGNRGGTMTNNVTQGVQGPLARIGRRVAAIVAECNYAQTRVTNLRNARDAYLP